MTPPRWIVVSAPGKIHLLGEHSVVYGRPALLAAINLRVTVTLNAVKGIYSSPSATHPSSGGQNDNLKKIIEPIVKKHCKFKTIPPYNLTISSQLPIGSGLGSSAAVSASYIAALLSFLKVKYNKDLVNKLTFEAEKTFHGKPSGGDNTTVVNGGLLIFQKGTTPLPIKSKINNFILIHSGKPTETTKEMIEIVKPKIKSILKSQEELTKQLILALKDNDEKLLIEIIKKAQKNLEKIGVVGKKAKKIIRDIETLDGAAKISGAGGVKSGSGMLLCYHKNQKKILEYAKQNNLEAFIIKLGEEGLRIE